MMDLKILITIHFTLHTVTRKHVFGFMHTFFLILSDRLTFPFNATKSSQQEFSL